MGETWEINSKDNKPPQFREVLIELKGGEIVKAYFLKNINKYVRGVNRWRLIGNGKYIPDKEVKKWTMIIS